MGALPRIAPVELSREQIDGETMRAHYKAGYGIVIVRSRFIGNKPLSDLFFDIICKNHENYCPERHGD